MAQTPLEFSDSQLQEIQSLCWRDGETASFFQKMSNQALQSSTYRAFVAGIGATAEQLLVGRREAAKGKVPTAAVPAPAPPKTASAGGELFQKTPKPGAAAAPADKKGKKHGPHR